MQINRQTEPAALWQLLVGSSLSRQEADGTKIPPLFRLGRTAIVQSTQPTVALGRSELSKEVQQHQMEK